MLRPRFHTTQTLVAGTALALEADASRHVAKALRMRAGDRLCLFDGGGREAAAEVAAIDRDRVTVRIDSVAAVDRESPLAVTLAIGVSRGDRMDFVVQKATELGVVRIQPLLTERTGVRLDASRWEKKQAHWQRIAISACEQCGRNRVPIVADAAPLHDMLGTASRGGDEALRLFLHPADAAHAAATLPQSVASLVLFVGPEGGFSDSEVDAARAAGGVPLALGPRVLRTETAPIAALAVVQARWGDLLAGPA